MLSNVNPVSLPPPLNGFICYQVIDLETGEALGPGHDGEICVKGPTVMKGIFCNVHKISLNLLTYLNGGMRC